jgi:predicted protein tyrosine phosphatase
MRLPDALGDFDGETQKFDEAQLAAHIELSQRRAAEIFERHHPTRLVSLKTIRFDAAREAQVARDLELALEPRDVFGRRIVIFENFQDDGLLVGFALAAI